MSTPVIPVAGTTTTAPAKKLNAIELIEQEIVEFFKQKEQAIANLHAVNGAIQGAQLLLAKLKAAEEKAKTEVESEAGQKVKQEVISVAKSEVNKVIQLVEKKS